MRHGVNRAWRRYAALAGICLLVWTLLASHHIRPFSTWYYQWAWYTVILILNAVIAVRERESPLGRDPTLALSLWLWSVPVWLLFETLNFRIANWYYVFAPGDVVIRRINAILAFGTVLPAIFLAYRFLSSLRVFQASTGPKWRMGTKQLRVVGGLGVLFLALALWRPELFFPLVWGSLTLLLEPWNYRRCPERSLLADLGAGRYGRTLRLLTAGAGIGLLWELFNALSETRWIYTVPGLEEGKLFEMPFLGYVGFPIFALDCFVIYQALVNLGFARGGWGGPRRSPGGSRARATLAWSAAGAFSLFALGGVDRWTVDSRVPHLDELPGVNRELAGSLRVAGVRRIQELVGSEPREVAARTGVSVTEAERLVAASRLVLLRGLGTVNAAALMASGVGSVCDLARASREEVAAAVRARRSDPHAGRTARVRLWRESARRECR